MSSKKQENKSTFHINVPVYASKRQEIGVLFPPDFESLVDHVITQIEAYNTKSDFIIKSKKNKHIQRQIGSITFERHPIGNSPTLLLNVSSYALNRTGEHIKEKETVLVEPGDRIGDKNNYLFLVPQIVHNEVQYYNWLVFIYEDPTREAEDLITIMKCIMEEILHQPIKNIKLPALMNELKETFPKVSLNVSSLNFHENELHDRFQAYETSFRSFTKLEFKYSNLPIEKIDELIKERFNNNFRQKVMTIFSGRREYKIKQEAENFKAGANLLVEQYFNFTEEFPMEQYKDLYQKEFIMTTMTKVLEKYLLNGED